MINKDVVSHLGSLESGIRMTLSTKALKRWFKVEIVVIFVSKISFVACCVDGKLRSLKCPRVASDVSKRSG